jgi:hypothetical protein
MTGQTRTAEVAVENDAQGEGNHAAARDHQDAQKRFSADKAKGAKWAYEAADAVDGPALEPAHAESAKR